MARSSRFHKIQCELRDVGAPQQAQRAALPHHTAPQRAPPRAPPRAGPANPAPFTAGRRSAPRTPLRPAPVTRRRRAPRPAPRRAPPRLELRRAPLRLAIRRAALRPTRRRRRHPPARGAPRAAGPPHPPPPTHHRPLLSLAQNPTPCSDGAAEGLARSYTIGDSSGKADGSVNIAPRRQSRALRDRRRAPGTRPFGFAHF